MPEFNSRRSIQLATNLIGRKLRRPLASHPYRAESLEARRMLIASGETLTGTISAAGEVDDYTFTASAGESVVAGVMETVAGSSLSPRIQLISPTATVLFTVTGAIGNGSTAFNLATGGTYTIRITDASSAQTGGYAVSLAKVGGAQLNTVDGGAVTSGEYRSGSIDTGDIDIYTINATSTGTLIAIGGELTGQPLDLSMAVFTPSGGNLYNSVNGTVLGTTQTLLAATGTYYVVVWDANFNATGTYNLSLASTPGTQVVDADSGALSSGVRRTGTISAADLDVYTIAAPINGSLLVSLTEINSPPANFQPTLAVYSPTGAQLSAVAGTVGREYFLNPTAGGTYTVVVYDQSQDSTGDYGITAVIAPGAQPTDVDSGPITSGQFVTGTIDGGDIDVYTIAGTSGGTLVATVAESVEGSALTPGMIIISPTGAVLHNAVGTVSDAVALSALPATGTYTIMVHDSGAVATGGYAMTVASVPASVPIVDADSVTLSSGVRRTGSLPLGDMDVYTINVPINSNLLVNLTEAATAPALFQPQLLVVAPNGGLLFNQAGAIGRDYTLTGGASGTYTIMVIDQSEDAVGDYALTAFTALAAQPTDADSGPITSGVNVTGSFNTGDVDVYTLTGSIGGSILINLSEIDAGLEPAVLVTGPTGTVLANTSATVAYVQVFSSLTAAGTYTIAIYDNGADDTGNYAMTVVNVPTAAQPTDADSGPITSGAYRSGTLDIGDIDVFTTTVNLGSSLLVSVAESSVQTMNTQLMVFAPNGSVLYNTAGTVGTLTLQQNVTAAGTYVIAVFDQFGEDTGSYNLTAVNGTGAQIVDSDSAPLTYAEYRQGVLDPGDLDVYTLTGTQTASLLTVLDESEFLGPAAVGEAGVVIFAPNGSVLRNTATSTGLGVIDSNLAATGTYTVAIYEQGADEFMRYGLTCVSTAAAPITVGDGGPLVSGVTRRATLDYGDIDAFSFNATAGQSLLLALQEVDTTPFNANIVIATPTGATLTNSATIDGINYRSDSLVTGTYTVFVFDQFGDDFGNYAMTLGLSNTAQPITGDSGPLTTTPRFGEVALGDIDIYTVAATAGVNFNVTLNETPSGQTFQPRVLIYKPDGTFVSDNFITNANTITVSSVVAGTYTVMVAENGSNALGNYSIALGVNAATTDTVPPRFVEGEYRYNRVAPELVAYASENVASSLQISDITLTNTTTATVIPSASLSVSYEAATNKIQVSTPGVAGGILANGNYTLTFSGTGITDDSGNALDGNANGVGGDDYTLNFFVLQGDLNRDKKVSFDDLLIEAQNYGKIGLSFAQGNINYDSSGTVNFDDLLPMAQNYGTILFSVTPITRDETKARIVDDLLN